MPDWATIALVLGACGGLATGIAGLITARKSARKTEVEALTETVEALQAENTRLRECVAEVKRENRHLLPKMRRQSLPAAPGRQTPQKKAPPPPVTLTCQQCGKTFTKPTTARRAKYCSRSCANQAAYQRKKTAEPEPTTAACDHCDQPFTYQRKAQPRRYCSKRCADAAFKQRQQSQPSETPPDPPAPAIHLPWGHYLGPDTGATTVPPLECAICGRPKEGDATGWRVRAYRTSPRYDYLLLSICPVHYRPGEPAPHLYGEGTHWG